jgi:glutathione synthase/RimK-type ligase-like ATP-grasp enzyme
MIDYQRRLENTCPAFSSASASAEIQDPGMSQTLIVTHSRKDCSLYSPGDNTITFADYMSGGHEQAAPRTRVINLCRSFDYLSEGYYCSLLAEARGHHVIPSVRTLNDLGKKALYRIHIDDFGDAVYQSLEEADPDQPVVIHSFFGQTADTRFRDLATKLFEAFPCPALQITLRKRKRWEISSLKPRSPNQLGQEQAEYFAAALDDFSRKVWRKRRARKASRYDLAILCDPEESMPPSDKGALKCMIRAGKELGVDCEVIRQRDYLRLPEYDGLFIRTTTNIDHYTYRFAKKAESEGLVVMDDSSSILRCTNKIYLADLFRINKVPSPRTVVLYKGQTAQLHALEEELGFPIVVKIPDGAFSKGVEKASNREELATICKKLFRRSTLLLAQEFLYTEFDWRIGVLDNKALFACRYYMVKNHWQIYRHGKRTDSGGFETLPIDEVPGPIVKAALRATRPIGDSLYGVDLKEKKGKGYVIEVNDNPNIDRGIEDKHLGMELYRRLIGTFLQRMEARRGH